MPEGRVPRAGDVLKDPPLADSLERLGAEGAAPFYTGDIGAAVSEHVCRQGGVLTREDLAAYRAEPREPVRVSYRGRDVLTNPPPSAGGTLLGYALGLLDRDPPPPDALAIVRAMERAQDERTPGVPHRAVRARLPRPLHGQPARLDHASVGARRRRLGLLGDVHERRGLGHRGPGHRHPRQQHDGRAGPLAAGVLHPSARAPAAVDDGPDRGARRRRRAGARARLGGLEPDPLDAAAGDRQRARPRDDRGPGGRRPAPALRGRARLRGAGRSTGACSRAAGYRLSWFRDRNLFFGGCQAVERDSADGRAGRRRRSAPRRRRRRRLDAARYRKDMALVPPPHDVLASDAERERVATALRDHAGEGRLDADELEKRLDKAYARPHARRPRAARRGPPVGRPRKSAPRPRSDEPGPLPPLVFISLVLIAIWAMSRRRLLLADVADRGDGSSPRSRRAPTIATSHSARRSESS